jgi:AraC-like DNA-binding protein
MASSAILSFTDPYPYQAAVRGAQLEFLPTEKGNFRAELTKVTFESLWMQRGKESLARVFHGAVSPERSVIGFSTDLDQPEYRHCGADVSPGAIILDDHNEMYRQTKAACRWGAMSLKTEAFIAAGTALTGRPVGQSSVSIVIRPAPALMSRLFKLHAAAGHLAEAAPDILGNPQVSRALENALVHAMITCLADKAEERVRTQRKTRIMARFEEFQAAHDNIPVYLAEVCAAVGVSERTLRACCQEQLGMGPIHYLWLRRMHLARRALVAATSKTSTVTGIAADYGFWELGRFAVEYRALFGESPSQSLSRSRLH